MKFKSAARSAARSAALDILSTAHQARGKTSAALAAPHVQLPYLHNLPAEDEDNFRRIVGRLAETHEFVSYSDAITRIASGYIDRPYAAFSFDDGFVSNLRAASILEEFGARGMFFVPTDFIGTRTTAEAREFFGFSDGVYEGAMTWGDLEDLKSRGHEIGNHTSGHKVLSWVSPAQAIDQIHSGADAIRAVLGDCEHFAWPRGRYFHMTNAAVKAVFDSGHTSCTSAERGAHAAGPRTDPSRVCFHRNHVIASWPQRHIDYFMAAAASNAAARKSDWSYVLEAPTI